jgi:hypothetical protein
MIVTIASLAFGSLQPGSAETDLQGRIPADFRCVDLNRWRSFLRFCHGRLDHQHRQDAVRNDGFPIIDHVSQIVTIWRRLGSSGDVVCLVVRGRGSCRPRSQEKETNQTRGSSLGAALRFGNSLEQS